MAKIAENNPKPKKKITQPSLNSFWKALDQSNKTVQ